MLKAMHESSSRGEAMVVSELLSFAIANMISQVIVSRRLFETVGSEFNEFKEMVVELMTLAGFFNVEDCIPSMAWMDLQGIEGKMKKLHKRFEVRLVKTIKEHADSADKRKGKPDLLDMLMANHENSNAEGERLSMTNIKALLLVRLFSLQFTNSSPARTLIHSFDWKLPDDVVDLNMDESFGLTLQKSLPLSALVSPRLPLSAYACQIIC
ncbi:hypothetical protein FEM48_Zijuj02G0045500 [Ziziphus jujuba var. spinosa]|uniref:Uncharacterized protein n=1 Tax=Ziziphus jujuba var. spinosa TaxID=714518 RepID=A0A978VTN2_ZIZJJ|nr:hypothetical protein FEM48_Zijuj02G0045500 [Ziziphus jujuba var. spinosa]